MNIIRRLLFRLLGLAGLAWVIACVGMAVFQRQLLYFPQQRNVETPLTRLQTDAGEVLVSVQERAGSKALIYLGGNAEDVSLAFGEFKEEFPDHSVYMLHYRGFGGSAGAPGEAALVADAIALFDSVWARHHDVSVIGRSLGSGIAVQLALRRPVRRVALVTPFDSVEAIAGELYPWLPVRWLLADRFDSAAVASNIRIPTLVVVAGRDRLVTSAHSRRLVESIFPAYVTCRLLPDADHDDVAADPAYFDALRHFLNGNSGNEDCAPWGREANVTTGKPT